jgi:hypothetical protein
MFLNYGRMHIFLILSLFLMLAYRAAFAQIFIPFSNWGAKGSWKPTDLGSALYAWYDTKDSTSVRTGVAGVSQAVSGDPASVWEDRSGNSFHLEQTISARQPIYSSTAWNSAEPTIIWDANDDSLLTSALTWQRYTIAAVIRHNSVSNVRALSQNFFWFTWNSTSNSINWDQNGNRLNSSFIPTAGSYYLYVLVRPANGTNREKFVNGTSVVSSASNPDDNNSQVLYMGNDYSAASRGADAYISEVVIFNTDLGVTQRQQLEGYLAWKWGIAGSLPMAHPYSSAPP